MENMSDGRMRILSPFTGHKKRKTWNKTAEKYMPEETSQSLAETDRGWYYNQEGWLEEFLDNKGEFYNGCERDDNDNDNEIYNENYEQKQLSEGFANSITNSSTTTNYDDFAICKHCSGTLLLVEDANTSHGFGRMWNLTFENGNCLSNSLKTKQITPR